MSYCCFLVDMIIFVSLALASVKQDFCVYIGTGGSDGTDSACNVGDLGSIPGPGRSPGEGNGNPLQYSCLENPMDRDASAADHSLWGCKELDTTEQLTL